jgi:hypothetical protein
MKGAITIYEVIRMEVIYEGNAALAATVHATYLYVNPLTSHRFKFETAHYANTNPFTSLWTSIWE